MDDVVFRDRAAYLPATETLVVADLHVGRAEASSVAYPLGERDDLVSRLAAHLDAVSPAEVVFAGDVLHAFGSVPRGVRETLRALADACRDAGARPVMVAGNHDAMLGDAWDGPVHDQYRAGDGDGDDGGGGDGHGDALVCHGHEAPAGDAALYVVGHDHPSVDVEGRKRPCFLYGEGTYRGGDVLMLPAFTRLAAGATVNDMRADDFGSPLVTDADALRVVVYDADADEALTFPPLGRFRRLL